MIKSPVGFSLLCKAGPVGLKQNHYEVIFTEQILKPLFPLKEMLVQG